VSVGAPAGPRLSPAAATAIVRLAPLCLSLAAFIAAFGPPRRIAQRFGWRFGQSAPVLFQRLLCAGLGVRVRRHGVFSVAPKQLIVSNHVSWLDIPILGSLAPMSFLAKKEVGAHPVGRELVAMQGVVYIDRRRRSCIPAVNASMAEAIRAGVPVVLFAEATTGDGNRLLRFRSSHFEAIRQAAAEGSGGETVIQPIYLDYSRIAGLPMARGERPRIAWYGDMTFFDHFLRYIRGGGVTCDVFCGVPIPVSPGLDRKTAARLTEAAVRELALKARARKAPSILLGVKRDYMSRRTFWSP
jgi:1-acyl-sn-glycerol-3-phosphate acyltransferase